MFLDGVEASERRIEGRRGGVEGMEERVKRERERTKRK
jgi:hypothetical protein